MVLSKKGLTFTWVFANMLLWIYIKLVIIRTMEVLSSLQFGYSYKWFEQNSFSRIAYSANFCFIDNEQHWKMLKMWDPFHVQKLLDFKVIYKVWMYMRQKYFCRLTFSCFGPWNNRETGFNFPTFFTSVWFLFIYNFSLFQTFNSWWLKFSESKW